MLPSAIASLEEFRRIVCDQTLCGRAIEAICRTNGLSTNSLRRYPTGSRIVFAVGSNHVVKLFGPNGTAFWTTEHSVLSHIQHRLPVPTPEVVATGDLDGWPYIIMTQLRGIDMQQAWPQMPEADRLRIAYDLGRAIAHLHALPTETLKTPQNDWPAFLERQMQNASERQRKHGLSEPWLSQIPAFLASVDLSSAATRPPCLLHTEISREHVLVERIDQTWQLSGLFDFEPAMLAHPQYELVSVGIFLACGHAPTFRAFLTGYGYSDSDLTPDFQQRCLAYTLLHRYSNLKWFLSLLPQPPSICTLSALAPLWFPLHQR